MVLLLAVDDSMRPRCVLLFLVSEASSQSLNMCYVSVKHSIVHEIVELRVMRKRHSAFRDRSSCLGTRLFLSSPAASAIELSRIQNFDHLPFHTP